MTAADLIRDCKAYQAEHGIIALLNLLEDIIECQAQASGVVLLDEDEYPDSLFDTVMLQ